LSRATDGAAVHLDGGDDLPIVLDRIDGAGTTVIRGGTLITEDIGCFAPFIDGEGDRLALHSPHQRLIVPRLRRVPPAGWSGPDGP
jgi:predicted enzyme related to lactoylglutathione lyase